MQESTKGFGKAVECGWYSNLVPDFPRAHDKFTKMHGEGKGDYLRMCDIGLKDMMGGFLITRG
ncbi:hypothetical protein GF325_01510 [Candidatus Bathyarchaeota archaeon]|nr:hypothetical protein [Candidatus Bathyarchaeota archaeon]